MGTLMFVFSPHGHCCLFASALKAIKASPIFVDQPGTARASGQNRADGHGGCLRSEMAKPSHGLPGAGIWVSVGACVFLHPEEPQRIGLLELVMRVSLVTCCLLAE